MNLNVLKWHARRLRPLLRPICWMTRHKRGVIKMNAPVPGTPVEADMRLRIFECPRCLRETRYVDKPSPATSPADGSPHFRADSPADLTRTHHEAELRRLRGGQ